MAVSYIQYCQLTVSARPQENVPGWMDDVLSMVLAMLATVMAALASLADIVSKISVEVFVQADICTQPIGYEVGRSKHVCTTTRT